MSQHYRARNSRYRRENLEGFRDVERIVDQSRKDYKNNVYNAITDVLLNNYNNWSNDEIKEWINNQTKPILQNLLSFKTRKIKRKCSK